MKYVPRILFEIEFEYVRSRGPGGQHVNRTNSAVLLRWNVPQSSVFSDEDKELILSKLRNSVSHTGDLILRSDEHREQDSNRKKVLDKLERLFEKAFFVQKKRTPTKPTRSSQRKRVAGKKQRGEIKAARSKVRSFEE